MVSFCLGMDPTPLSPCCNPSWSICESKIAKWVGDEKKSQTYFSSIMMNKSSYFFFTVYYVSIFLSLFNSSSKHNLCLISRIWVSSGSLLYRFFPVLTCKHLRLQTDVFWPLEIPGHSGLCVSVVTSSTEEAKGQEHMFHISFKLAGLLRHQQPFTRTRVKRPT